MEVSEALIERTYDLPWILALIARPAVWDRMEVCSFEEATTAMRLAMEAGDCFWRSDGIDGFIAAFDVGAGHYEIHACCDPKDWGWKWLAACREAVEGLQRVGARRITTFVPDWMPESKILARRCGFREAGRQENKWVYKGRFYGQTNFEMRKEA